MKTNGLGLLLAAGLVGCGSGSLGEEPVIEGQIAGWLFGSGHTLSVKLSGENTGSLPPVATAPIDDTGRFAVKLPGGAQLAPYRVQSQGINALLRPDCTGNLEADPVQSQGKFASAIFYADTNANRSLELEKEEDGVGTSYSIMYYDHDFDASGELTCMDGSETVRFKVDEHFRTGWNYYTVSFIPKNAEGVVTYVRETKAPSSDVLWH